jgi:hypothetical protein
VTASARTPDSKGYWVLFSNGVIAPFGDAQSFGWPNGLTDPSTPANAILPTSDGKGYWVVAAKGGVFSFGDAPFEGSMGGKPLNSPIIAAAST